MDVSLGAAASDDKQADPVCAGKGVLGANARKELHVRSSIPASIFLALMLMAADRSAEAMSYSSEIVNGKTCDAVAWTDANGNARKVWLVRATGDTGGYVGGYIERYSYFVGGTQVTGQSDGTQPGVSGLGCAVDHHSSYSASKANTTGASTAFLVQGASHCIWRFQGSMSGAGGSAGLKIDYTIGEGRDDVLWSVSYDCSALAADTLQWDARGPYVQFDWNGDGKFYDWSYSAATPAISGVRWGDRFKFQTSSYVWGSPTTTTWDYAQANTIPYMMLYKSAAIGDVELGVVQTQTWAQHDAGGYWWGKGGQTGTGMPDSWNCPFQLNAYENYSSEKMAWGSAFGFVGANSYTDLAGGARSGYPYQGYATYIILGRHSAGVSDAYIAGMEGVQQTTLTASKGTVATSGARFAGLASTAAYQPAGWNHVYGAWTVAASGNEATLNFSVGAGTSVLRPLVTLTGYTSASAPAQVRFNGVTLTAGSDYVVTVDTGGQRLWLTLLRTLGGTANALEIGATAGSTTGSTGTGATATGTTGTSTGTSTGSPTATTGSTGTTSSTGTSGGTSASGGSSHCGFGGGIALALGILAMTRRRAMSR